MAHIVRLSLMSSCPVTHVFRAVITATNIPCLSVTTALGMAAMDHVLLLLLLLVDKGGRKLVTIMGGDGSR